MIAGFKSPMEAEAGIPFIIPQIVGLAAVCLFLLSYQQKTRRGIIAMNATSRGLYILQYLLLGAYSGAVLDVLGTLSSVLAAKKGTSFIRRHRVLVLATVNLAIVAAGVTVAVLCRNPWDLLPIGGVLLHTVAFWISDERIIRRVSLLGSPFWLAYNLISRAYGSAIGDFLSIVSILTAMVRYRREGEGETST